MDRYKGKTVLITGGTTGMGLATAKLLVEEGAQVMVTGRTPATIEAAQTEFEENAIAIYSDALPAKGCSNRIAPRWRDIWIRQRPPHAD